MHTTNLPIELAILRDELQRRDLELAHERLLLTTLLLDSIELDAGYLFCRHCRRSIDQPSYVKLGIPHDPDCVVGFVIRERR